MHRRGIELVLDALEMVEPFDRMIELGAFLFGELGFHVGDGFRKLRPVEFVDRGGDVGQHREPLGRNLGKPAEHDDLLLRPARYHRQDARPDRGHNRRMTGQHAEVALDPGNVDLIDLAGEGELFGRDEIEVKGGHDLPSEGEVASGEGAGAAIAAPIRYSRSYAASASFLPFSTASSIVPTM